MSAGASASEEGAGAGVLDVFAVGADGGAVDPDVLDPGAVGDEAVGARGQVVHAVHLAHGDLSGFSLFEEAFDWGTIGWRLTPDKGSSHLVIMDVTLEPGEGHDFHKHPGQEEMIIVKQGEITQYIERDSADLTMLPTTTVPLESEGDARKVLKLIDALEEHDDVQNVYANFDIPDSVLQSVEA